MNDKIVMIKWSDKIVKMQSPHQKDKSCQNIYKMFNILASRKRDITFSDKLIEKLVFNNSMKKRK